uniref:uS7m-2 n=1 Tax=Polytomella magna TaxID=353565 RepID=UPI002240E504
TVVLAPSKYDSQLKIPLKPTEMDEFEELRSFVDISIEKEADYVMNKFVGRLIKGGEKATAQQVLLRTLLHTRRLMQEGNITSLK